MTGQVQNAATARPPTQVAGRGRVSWWGAVQAEMLRAKGSASSRFVLFGGLLCLMQGLSWWFVATSAMPDWNGLLGWQSLYATALLAPVAALLASAVVVREATAREGGTWVRPLSPRTAVWARGTVLAWRAMLLNAAVTLPLLGFGLLGGLDSPPVWRFVGLWLVFWAGSLLPLALGLLMAPRLGLMATTGLAVGWQIAGTLAAETPLWWAQPWSWAVRASLPLLGVHQNGTRLEPTSPLWSESPALPAFLAATTAGALLALNATRADRLRRSPVTRARTIPPRLTPLREVGKSAADAWGDSGHRVGEMPRVDQAAVVDRGRPHLVRAQMTLLRTTAVPWLVAASLVAVAVVGGLWNSGYVTGFSTWLLVPLGSCVLACLIWSANAGGWRVALLRARLTRLAAAMLGMSLAVLALVVAFVWGIGGLSRGGQATIAFPAVLFATGAMVLTVSLWLVTRLGTGVALVATLVFLVFSLVFGGTWMADGPLWLVGALGWPLTATTPDRICVALSVALVISAAATTAWLSALRRAARCS